MADRRNLSSSLSSRIINYLLEEGYSQSEIARMLGVSGAFISLVKSKERSFTLDHIESLADILGVPLGALLLTITKPKNPSPAMNELSLVTERLMQKADAVRKELQKPSMGSSRR